MNRRLFRSSSDRKIGGVAAGTAAYFDIDVSISRVLWLLLAIFTGGAFLIVYLVMWAVVPEEPWSPPAMAGAAAPSAAAAGVVAGKPAGESDPEPAEGASEAGGTADAPAGATDTPAPWTPPAQASSTWNATNEVDRGPGPHVIFGVILILIGGWFLAQQFLPWLNFGLLWPIGLVVIGVVILLAALRRTG
jgi:phage shock protein PspC (stress-responsive transcriptional regulator)